MKLNINELKYIINEIKNTLLNEIKAADAYPRYYQNYIPIEDYNRIISTIQGNDDRLGEGVKWLFNLYRRDKQHVMDELESLHTPNGDGYLDIYLRAKKRGIIKGAEADLGHFKSIYSLQYFVNNDLDYSSILNRTRKEFNKAVQAAKDEIEVLYEDEKWYVISPHTYEASVYWGSGTKWCTSSKSNFEQFESYNDCGCLVIFINKLNGEKYQYSGAYDCEFKDKNNKQVASTPYLQAIGATEGLINYFKKGEGKHWLFEPDFYNVLGCEYNDIN